VAGRDLTHLAEKIQDLGKGQYEAVFRLMQEILQHFLLIEHSPATDQRLHWGDEIDGFRDQIDRRRSPVVRGRPGLAFDEASASPPARAMQDGALLRDARRRRPVRALPLHAQAGSR
jgi:hypothetical protein